LKWQHPGYVTLFMAYMTSVLFAVLYEMQEYLEDVFSGSHRLGDGPDTANDLLLNLIGGLVTVLLVTGFRYYRSRNKKV
jgi:uncharacterized membrane protein YjdF